MKEKERVSIHKPGEGPDPVELEIKTNYNTAWTKKVKGVQKSIAEIQFNLEKIGKNHEKFKKVINSEKDKKVKMEMTKFFEEWALFEICSACEKRNWVFTEKIREKVANSITNCNKLILSSQAQLQELKEMLDKSKDKDVPSSPTITLTLNLLLFPISGHHNSPNEGAILPNHFHVSFRGAQKIPIGSNWL